MRMVSRARCVSVMTSRFTSNHACDECESCNKCRECGKPRDRGAPDPHVFSNSEYGASRCRKGLPVKRSRHSAIYAGHIRHRRFLPTQNAFCYRTFMLYLDLEELPHIFDGARLWSYERLNVACFQRRYFYGDAQVALADAVRSGTAQAIGRAVTGPIRMLTHVRYWGYCYNPVTFYYLFEQDGKTLGAITAEITNTPWGERHTYYLDCRKADSPKAGRYRWQFPKAFHVSPFMPMNVHYDWRFRIPGENLNVHMQNMIDGNKHFDATLTLTRQEITPARLQRVLLYYPVMTTKVVTMIHWQALRLWFKRTPFFAHPKYQQEKDA